MHRRDWLTIGTAAATLVVVTPLLVLYLREEGRQSLAAADRSMFRGALVEFRLEVAYLKDRLESQQHVSSSFVSEWIAIAKVKRHDVLHSNCDDASKTCVVTIKPRGSAIQRHSVIVSFSHDQYKAVSIALLERSLSRPHTASILVARWNEPGVLFRDVEDPKRASTLYEQLVQRAAGNELGMADLEQFKSAPDVP